LPPTQSIFGRISKPQSHRLYRVSGLAASLQFKDPITGDTLLELRGDGGRQTVFPPSIHPSGESIAWSADGDPQQVDYVALTKQVKLLAARCLIARYLPAVTNDTELWGALTNVDKRVSERIQDWMEVPTAPDVSSNTPATIGGQPSQRIPDYCAGLPRTNRVSQVLHSFASSDLNDAVRELSDKKKPGRGDLLYRKSIKMGVAIESGHIDKVEVKTALYEASVRNGLVEENGKHDVLRNIERGFAYGAAKAREVGCVD
jgi:hypothetical protein